MKLLALDGNSIINRAFYGIRPLTTKDGTYTNAIYGFMNILLKLINEVEPDAVVAAFDLKAPTFRHKMYAEYKAGRKKMPDELAMQIPIMKDVLRAFGCVVLEKEGFEADDILGTVSAKCEKEGALCTIATGDRDALQLVSDKVAVLLAATKAGSPVLTEYTPEKLMEDYGVSPSGMIELKAIMGDSSDNIPGVAGIGQKGATTLISTYKSIDYIYENLDTLDIKEGVRNKLIEGKESAFLSRTLGTICRDADINLPDEVRLSVLQQREELRRLLVKLEMFKLCERLSLNADENTPRITQTQADMAITIEYTESAPDNCVFAYLDGIAAARQDEKYLIIKNVSSISSAKGIIIHDSKQLYHSLKAGKSLDIAFDTMLAAYIDNPDVSDYSYAHFANVYSVAKRVCEYAELIYMLDVTQRMYDDLSKKLEENNQIHLLCDIEIPLSYTLYKMERDGFLVDKAGIAAFSVVLEEEAEKLRQFVIDEVGYEFNLNSPKQLGIALFETLGLPHGKKTKTGYSTNADVLNELRYQSTAVDALLQYRTVTKLKSTYCDGLLRAIDEDGRIRSTLNQTETRTGRISSTEPNLQNIPVRTPLGREMRKFFIAKPDCVLVDADYSQIELRVLAAVANDETMINAFRNNDDIHTITASQVFSLPVDMVTSELRSRAKAVNFGIVYGIGAFSLSKDIGVSVAEAKRYINGYLETYKGVDRYMTETVEKAKEDGFVTTLCNRRRYLPELSASNFNLRSFGERVARNAPIQGTAADIIKIAMNRVNTRIEKEGLQSRLIMQIHDELIVESPLEEADKAAAILKEEMESAMSLAVPLTVEVKSGKCWYDTK